MDHKSRGFALVINVRSYEEPNPFGLDERVRSIKDVENLKKTLEYLEFDFQPFENLKAQEMRDKMKYFAQDVDHSELDCFLCVVMSHGNKEKIVAYDNEEVSFDEIMAPIKSCESLKNKPKLFFFQTCRGEKEMEPVSLTKSNLPSPSPRATPNSEESSDESIESETNIQNDPHPNVTTNTTINGRTKFESESNLLVYHSTLPEHLSYSKGVKEGTIFIKCLCNVFDSCAYTNLPKNLSLAQMITKINKKVIAEGLQIADPVFRMQREVYFLPKNVSVKIILLLVTFLTFKMNFKKIGHDLGLFYFWCILAHNEGRRPIEPKILFKIGPQELKRI